MKWTKFTDRVSLPTDADRVAMQHAEKLPPERKHVMVLLRMMTKEGKPNPRWDQTACVVGYLRYAAGDKASPYFVCHAIPGPWKPVAWADCLPEGFDRGYYPAF